MIAASGFLSIKTVTGKGTIGHLSIGMRSINKRVALLSGVKPGKGTFSQFISRYEVNRQESSIVVW
jgi:hypothetical protein